MQNTAASVALSGLLAALPSIALASPTPGQYRIDSEAVTSSGSGMTATQLVQRTDGATGRVTVIRKAAADPTPPAPQTIEGKGPVTWCVEAPGKGAPPPPAMAAACQTSGTASNHQAVCNGATIDQRWRAVDAKTWERSLKAEVQMNSASPADSARKVFELTQHTMSATERAQAQAELAALPSAGAMQAEMAPVIAQLEQQVRTGKPDEAAAAKQQLAALRSAGVGGPASSVQTTVVRERWTRIADTCSARR